MKITHETISISTKGHGDVLDITGRVSELLVRAEAGDGLVVVFVPGSTGAVTTIEHEPGAVRDLVEALERIAPSDRTYHHDARWGDGNGFSHLRAALLGPSLTIPVTSGSCVLGTWQQIVLVENDNRPRERRVILSFMGEAG